MWLFMMSVSIASYGLVHARIGRPITVLPSGDKAHSFVLRDGAWNLGDLILA